MLKIQLSGTPQEVRSYVYELRTNGQYEIVGQSFSELPDEWRWIASVRFHPSKRMRTVCLHFTDGGHLYLPMLDVMQCEIEPGVHLVSGGIFEVSAQPKPELE